MAWTRAPLLARSPPSSSFTLLAGLRSPRLPLPASLPARARHVPSPLVTRASGEDDDFEARLAQLRRKSGSGTGKKAEERKARKEGTSTSSGESSLSSSSTTASQPLPPVPLEDPVSGGLPVVLGFSPYAERLNGQAAMLGLTALLSVELFTGQSLLVFHDTATLLLQIYILAGAGALYVKFEKEKNSVWPN